MTKIHTKINGQEFEIEIADGLRLDLSDGKLTVKPSGDLQGKTEQHFHYHYNGIGPYWGQPPVQINPQPPLPNITYGTQTIGGQMVVGNLLEDNNENVCLRKQKNSIGN